MTTINLKTTVVNGVIHARMDDFTEVRTAFMNGNLHIFDGCKKLHLIVEKRKEDSSSVVEFYKSMGWSKDYGGRLCKVGRVFKSYTGAQMSAYGISQLTRMAALEDLGRFIADQKLCLTCEDLDLIKKFESHFPSRQLPDVNDFLNKVTLLRAHRDSIEKEESANQGTAKEASSSSETSASVVEPDLLLKCMSELVSNFHQLNISIGSMRANTTKILKMSKLQQVPMLTIFQHKPEFELFYNGLFSAIAGLEVMKSDFENGGFVGEDVAKDVLLQYPPHEFASLKFPASNSSEDHTDEVEDEDEDDGDGDYDELDLTR